MRLSKESISYYLSKQKSMLPLVYCCSKNERFKTVNSAIVNYDGNAINGLSNVLNIKSKNSSILIFIDDFDEEDILDVEKKLISLIKDKAVILDIKGIDSHINKRNFVLSLLRRYNINIIKGTKEDINFLIEERRKISENNLENENNSYKYKVFARNNHVNLVVSGDEYYITDGFNEFYIKSNNKKLNNESCSQDILSGMLSVGIAVSKDNRIISQSILVTILVFITSRECTMQKYEELNNHIEVEDYIGSSMFNECLLKEIYIKDVEKIKGYGSIYYSFTREL